MRLIGIRSFLKDKKAFTLIEMLIVLFVIGVLLLIIVPNLSNTGADAQAKGCNMNKKLLQAQGEAYYLENNHQYPATLGELKEKGFIKELPICPSKPTQLNPYYYETQGDTLVVKCSIHDAEKVE